MVNNYDDPGCRKKSVLHLGNFLPRSEVNGPGIRAVVWVQGCPHRCQGCFNPQFQNFSPANPITAGEISDRILSQRDIDGVTFSGGEPFSQASPLAEAGRRIRNAGLSVVTYTGYEYDQIAQGQNPGWKDLLAITDLLIAGPYIAALQCPGSLRGSTNQQVIPLSGRIVSPTDDGKIKQGATEFTIAHDGTITVTGFPEIPLIRQLNVNHTGES